MQKMPIGLSTVSIVFIVVTVAHNLSSESLTLNAYYPIPMASYNNLTTGNLTACLGSSSRCLFGTTSTPPEGKLVVQGETTGGFGSGIVINDTNNLQAASIGFCEGASCANTLGRIGSCGSRSTMCSPAGALEIINNTPGAPIRFGYVGSITADGNVVEAPNHPDMLANPTALLDIDDYTWISGAPWTQGPRQSPTGLYVYPGEQVGIRTLLNFLGAFTINGQVRASAGSASAPAYSFVGDSDTGVFSSGNNALNFATNGIERMRITNSGLVGIGVTSPAYGIDLGPPPATNNEGLSDGWVNYIGRANGWSVPSSKKYKKDIEPLSPKDYESALAEIEKMNLVYYRYKNQKGKRLNLGVIAEEAPQQIVTEDRQNLSLREFATFTLAGLKALTNKTKTLEDTLQAKENENKELRKKLEQLETMLLKQ